MKNLIKLVLIVLLIVSCTRNDSSSYSNDKLDNYFEQAYNWDLGRKNQMKYIDSARTIVDQIPNNDSLKIKNVFKIANRYYTLKEFEGYYKYTKIAEQLAQSKNDSLSIAKANVYLGDYFIEFLKNDSAYFYYSKAKKMYEYVEDDYHSTQTILNLAQLLLFEKDYLGSEIIAVQVLLKAKQINDEYLIYAAYSTLGRALAGQNNFEKALDYYNKALLQTNNFDTERERLLHKAEVLNNIAYVYLEQNLYDEAKAIYEEGLLIKGLKKENTKFYISILDHYSYVNLKLGDKVKAIKGFQEVLRISDSAKNPLGKINVRRNLAEFYLSEKDTAQALAINHEAYIQAKAANFPDEILRVLDLYTEIDPKNGLKYAKEYIKISDSLQEQERSTRDKFARIEFETDEILQEKDKISSQKEIIQYGTLVIAVSGLLIFVIFYLKNKQKQLLLEKEQQKANEEIYQLMLEQQSKLDYVRTNEKKRIARELHDGVMNKLASTRLNLFILNKRKDEETIGKCLPYINGIQEIEKEVRGISHELTNELFSNKNNFDALLEELCHEQEELYQTNCIKQIDSEIQWETINASVKMNLYRIIQEALNNINKYAEAQTVIFTIRKIDNILFFSIEDNGKGFTLDKIKKGIGLKNIKERAENINGQFEIFSEISKGTKVTITINLATDHE